MATLTISLNHWVGGTGKSFTGGDLTDYNYMDEEDCDGEPVNDTSCELQAAQRHDLSTINPKPPTKSAGRRTG